MFLTNFETINFQFYWILSRYFFFTFMGYPYEDFKLYIWNTEGRGGEGFVRTCRQPKKNRAHKVNFGRILNGEWGVVWLPLKFGLNA